VTSQGQRFRRRALRRGYKVDEVDRFLDRVEATLAGDGLGAPVSSQEVHDVVFRVRFGGYDEWQVDLHLDRVERQLAELEERGGGFGRPEPRSGELRMGPPQDRMAPQPDRLGPQADRLAPQADRMGPPPERIGQPNRMPAPDRFGPQEPVGPPPVAPVAPGPMLGGPGMGASGPPPRPMPTGPGGGPGGPPRDGGYGRIEEPPPFGGGYDTGGYENVGRRGRNDMTTEIRMGGGPGGAGPGSAGPGSAGPGSAGPGSAGLGAGPSFGAAPDPSFGGGSPLSASEVAKLDQLRRTFQVRRFGSGYDTAQVDRFFDSVAASFTGRTTTMLSEAELASTQFNLVPGGYFEAEVDAAMREIRDIVSRRR